LFAYASGGNLKGQFHAHKFLPPIRVITLTTNTLKLPLLAVTVILATLCGSASAQNYDGEPVYIEDRIMRIIKDVRHLTNTWYPSHHEIREYDNGGYDRNVYESGNGYYRDDDDGDDDDNDWDD
jgi:hypothetical protein